MNEKRLQKEIKRLKRENKLLNARLRAYTGGEKKTAERMFYDRARIAEGKTFFDYIKSAVGASGIYSVYAKIYFALGKYVKISSFIRTLGVVMKAAYSGTAAFVALTAVVVALPAVLLFTLLGAGVSLVTRRKTLKEIDAISGRIYIVYGTARGEYGRRLEENGTVIEVTTSIFGCGAFGAKKKSGKRFATHIGCAYRIIKRLSLRKDAEIIKIF